MAAAREFQSLVLMAPIGLAYDTGRAAIAQMAHGGTRVAAGPSLAGTLPPSGRDSKWRIPHAADWCGWAAVITEEMFVAIRFSA
ncbi:MAG: hypothetical protein IPM02_18685 [Betaproteobacteria bacterium]|nr:hypothetical protein [Betaproteobacteria bacterium]